MVNQQDMDLTNYDKLRSKINQKDFETRNKGLDMWLWRFSFLGNISAIFFAYFLVYPALSKTITINFIQGALGNTIALILSVVFLGTFEIIKRYFIGNFSDDYFTSNRKLNFQVGGWFTLALAIVAISFYLSISGSKNLATTSVFKNAVVETRVASKGDSLAMIYDTRKKTYSDDNERLRTVTNDLRQRLAETPLNYMTARKEYQTSIDKNVGIIAGNEAEIDKLDAELNARIGELKENLNTAKSGHESEDTRNIFLFIIIVVINEVLIIGGIHFREYYEHRLFEINHQKFEKVYQKKDRYRALLAFVYGNGKLTPGDKVISGLELKDIVAEKTTIPNSNKLVDEFLQDMDRLNIFVTNGKRRNISATYNEAVNIVERFDDAFRVIENMK
jgi:hypothetical protein